MHWFLDPVKDHYFDFEGRATRKEFWMFVLIYLLLSIAVGVVDRVIGTMFLGTLFSLAVLLPSIAITARRLHDIGKSGWWQLIGLIPLLGLIIMIVWCATKGDEGPNAYGPAAGIAGATTAGAMDAQVSQTNDSIAPIETEVTEPTTEVPKEEENTQRGYGS